MSTGPQNAGGGPGMAGGRARLLAGLLDALLLGIVIAVACLVAAILLGMSGAAPAVLRSVGPVLALSLSVFYFATRDGRRPGTFGKQQFRLIVRRGDGETAGAVRLGWRALIKLTLAGLGIIGLLAPLFGHVLALPLLLAWGALLPVLGQGRGLQDWLSGTRVVRVPLSCGSP